MKKIVAINCSPRTVWNTATLVKDAAEGAKEKGAFVGPAKVMVSGNTLQVKDYSRFNWTMFDPETKKQRHETVFPREREKARALGSEMV